MNTVTDERLQDLVCLINNRLREFGPDTFPIMSWGIVRLMLGAVREWEEREPVVWPNTLAPDDPLTDGFHIGYTLGRLKDKDEPQTPGVEAIRTLIKGGTLTVPDPAITAGDYAEFEAVWPNIPDLQGEDIFAAEHGAPTGQPEPELVTGNNGTGDAPPMRSLEKHIAATKPTPLLSGVRDVPIEPPPLLAPLPDPVRVPVLSPQAAATLGPEHTTLTPLRPIGRDRAPDVAAINRPRPLSEADAEAKRQAELAEIIAHLQSIAKGKRLPTMTDYHGTRPKHLPMWATMQSRHNLSSWQDLAALTGLEYGARHLRVAGDADADEADPDLDDVDADDEIEDEPSGKRKRPNGTRIKHPRKMGYEYGAESRPGRKAMAPETLPELIKAVQGMAMAGVMPTQSQFDTAKPVVWPRATSLMSRFGMSWEQLREMAGLKPNPRWGATWQQTDAAA